DDAGVPASSAKTGVELCDPRSAQQAVDLLVGNVRANEPGRDLAYHRKRLLRPKLARTAVDREIRFAWAERRRRPNHIQRPGRADKFRRRIQRAGQIVSEQP